MTAKNYNIFMLLATFLAWLGFFILMGNFDPQQADLAVFILFYAVLFLALLGTIALFGFWLRILLNRKKRLPRFMALEAFRQALIFSLVIIIALLLQASRLLTWWNISLLALVAAFLEFVILLFRQKSDRN